MRVAGAAPGAAQALTLAVVAYRPKDVIEQRYRPLAAHLSAQLDGEPVQLRVLDQAQMEQALAAGQVDLLITNPSHYTLLRTRNPLTGALATLVSMEDGVATSQLGGVVIARQARAQGDGLAQLRGQRIGVPGTRFLGGYQAQALELLERGIELPRDAELEVLGSHDQVVHAVLAGRVDYGFVRTGVLEELARQGAVDLRPLVVLNPQHPPHFPYKVSTRLYPEWAVVALPHVDQRQVRRIASSLMALDEHSAVARAAGIGGFAPPGDYLPVENLARTLGLPPFDAPRTLRLRDVWARWQALWLLLIGAVTTASMAAAWQLRRRNQALLVLQQAQLRDSELHFRQLANGGAALLWTSDAQGRLDYFNEPWLRFTGRSAAEEAGDGWQHGLHPDDRAACLAAWAGGFAQRQPFEAEFRLRRADGGYRWLHMDSRPRTDSAGRFIGFIGQCYDVSERRESERRLSLAASVFTRAREGILITDPAGTIVEVNHAFCEVTGYAPEEVVGRNARLLQSGRQGPEFYARMWADLSAHGHWTGEIWNRRRSGEYYAESLTITAVTGPDGQVQHYVGLFTDITPQKEQQRQLERLAHYDALTGLPNRVLLADRLEQAMARSRRTGTRLVVALIDLDGFKAVNDRHGHLAGDDLLVALAARMREALRQSDTIARVGGDEFVAVITDLERDHDCLPMVQRLLAAAAGPVAHAGQVLQVSGSIGFTFYPQGEPIEADQLLRQADQAMYQAKLAGRNRYQVFDAELDRDVRSRHESVEDLRRGLAAGEFELHYQPQVNMRSGAVVGMEALLRWRHPQRGLLRPDAFLPAIERHPLELDVGRWVIGTALRQVQAWSALGLDVKVSVNISAPHLQHPGFVAELQAQLRARPGVPAGRLTLEVLETSALADIAGVSRVIADCGALGVGVSLDDFGTGYASLTYLKHLPVREIKIDRSFVRDMLHDPDDLAILLGVQGLARAFRKEVVAEGVETEPHGTLLLRLGCELGQGYGIARPMPAAQVPGWVATWQPPTAWAHTRPLAGEAMPFLYASVDHLAWLRALDGFLDGERHEPPPMSHVDCRFGVWLQGARAGAPDAVLENGLDELDGLHRALHEQAAALLRQHRHGDRDGVADARQRVHAHSLRLVQRLHAVGGIQHTVEAPG
ncbi:EAL domain-containing protein [Ideonella sp.]|uniref:EAL domain-containing protein n=1 Tax=Ideonella sp. TaxID=1929293 RepID=UPI0035AE18E4